MATTIENPFDVSYKGIRKPELITFKADGLVAADVGLAVNVTAEMTVSKAGDGETFIGILSEVFTDGYCSVRTGGVFEAAYSGSDPAYGQQLVTADADGKLKVAAGGIPVQVLSVDTVNKLIRFILP